MQNLVSKFDGTTYLLKIKKTKFPLKVLVTAESIPKNGNSNLRPSRFLNRDAITKIRLEDTYAKE
jgi:hypothetical protein